MSESFSGVHCPLPDGASSDRITLAHGEGGRLTRQLIQELIVPHFPNPLLSTMGDAVFLPASMGPMAMTTDSYVVSPLFFPGGDIGTLAIHGTVNDLAVAGAQAQWLSLSLIIEEGLATATLVKILKSIATAADGVGVQVVTGDTKVVPRGAVDQLFINTTGIGRQLPLVLTGLGTLQPGDVLIVSGPIGQHGMAVLAARDGFHSDPPLQSDSASLQASVLALLEDQTPLRAMRDATRGGVAAVLHEWSEATGLTLVVNENQIPVSPGVRALGELLGLDPLHVACEGTMVLAVPATEAARVCQVLRQLPTTREARAIGEVRVRQFAPVLVRRALGQEVPLEDPLGAPLPRIC